MKNTVKILCFALAMAFCCVACSKDHTSSEGDYQYPDITGGWNSDQGSSESIESSVLDLQVSSEATSSEAAQTSKSQSSAESPKKEENSAQPHSKTEPLNLKVAYGQQISPGNPGWWESGVEYSRIIELQHSKSGDNGVLLATFEELNGGQVSECGYPIYISYDKGKSWTREAFVTDPRGLSAQWMPTLYELPQDLGELPAGTVLLAATSIGQGKTSNALYQSQDSGKTWEFYSGIALGGNYGQGNGLYEPFLVMLDDGTLVCHYSDETVKEKHNQRLVYKTTTDGKNWSEAVETVALGPSLRPGMPVVTRLGDGRYFMVYEMVGMSGNPIYCRYSSDGLDWGSPHYEGVRIDSNGKQLGSSPYCAWTPYGGEKGTLVVSGCFMSSGTSTTGTDYFISNDYGKTWKTVSHPIPYSTKHSKIGYSNGFFFSKSGEYLYAVNNPEGNVEGYSQIVFAAVKLYG